ncbi:sugar phosphate nucleotidyltransferase, partial [Nitrincola sp. A-D6]|uniref:sugar phosphate nucleotidyltransferase n=1 Tax=Nitrincola sp. A-D6 TaxID=1545442 RepID=UPI0022859EB5
AGRSKTALLESIRDILPAGVEVISVRQPKALGLGHAVLCAAPIVGNEDFAVMLPDMLIDNAGQQRDMSSMAAAWKTSGLGQIMVEGVPEDQVQRYGIVDCAGVAVSPGESADIRGMVEKPDVASAPSNLAIVGRYILPARIMSLLKDTQPGAGDEIQLTDALQTLLSESASKPTPWQVNCSTAATKLDCYKPM